MTNIVASGTVKPVKKQNLWITVDVIRGLVAAADIVSIAGAAVFAYAMLVPAGGEILPHFSLTLLLLIWTTLLFRHSQLYEFRSIAVWRTNIRHFGVAGFTGLILLTGLVYLLGEDADAYKDWLINTVLLGFGLLMLARLLLSILVKKWIAEEKLGWKVALVGYGEQAKRFLTMVMGADHSWWRFIGVFDDRKSRIEDTMANYPLLGDMETLFDYVRRGQIQQVVVTLPWYAEERMLTMISTLRELPVTVSIGSDLIGCRFSDKRHEFVGGLRVLEVERAPLVGWDGIYKRTEDLILSGLMILFFSPVLAAVALAIKLESRGPVIFKQNRYGFNNELITVYKFRSMYHSDSPAKFKQATKGDPRITRVGAFIRRTSLDELPQLFNVFEGSMSLVGPRPHPVELNEEFEKLLKGYNGRHKVKPGITGWAQVNGWRGETESVEKMEKRVQHDVEYIESWSLLFDLKILFATAFKGWVHKNAY